MKLQPPASDTPPFIIVIAGEALAIVEGEERPLRQWDFVHCPARTNHAIVGAGVGPGVVFAVGSRDVMYRSTEVVIPAATFDIDLVSLVVASISQDRCARRNSSAVLLGVSDTVGCLGQVVPSSTVLAEAWQQEGGH